MMTKKKDIRKELLFHMIRGVQNGSLDRFCIAPHPRAGNLFLLLQNMKFYVTSLAMSITQLGETSSWTEKDMPFFIFLKQRNFLKEADAFVLAENGLDAVLTSYDADTQFNLTAFAVEQNTPSKILGIRASFQAKPVYELPEPIDGIVAVTKSLRIIADWQQQVAQERVKASGQESYIIPMKIQQDRKSVV